MHPSGGYFRRQPARILGLRATTGENRSLRRTERVITGFQTLMCALNARNTSVSVTPFTARMCEIHTAPSGRVYSVPHSSEWMMEKPQPGAYTSAGGQELRCRPLLNLGINVWDPH